MLLFLLFYIFFCFFIICLSPCLCLCYVRIFLFFSIIFVTIVNHGPFVRYIGLCFPHPSLYIFVCFVYIQSVLLCFMCAYIVYVFLDYIRSSMFDYCSLLSYIDITNISRVSSQFCLHAIALCCCLILNSVFWIRGNFFCARIIKNRL